MSKIALIAHLEQEKDRLITRLREELQDKLPGDPGAQLNYDSTVKALIKNAIRMYFRRKFNLLYVVKSKLLSFGKKEKGLNDRKSN